MNNNEEQVNELVNNEILTLKKNWTDPNRIFVSYNRSSLSDNAFYDIRIADKDNNSIFIGQKIYLRTAFRALSEEQRKATIFLFKTDKKIPEASPNHQAYFSLEKIALEVNSDFCAGESVFPSVFCKSYFVDDFFQNIPIHNELYDNFMSLILDQEVSALIKMRTLLGMYALDLKEEE